MKNRSATVGTLYASPNIRQSRSWSYLPSAYTLDRDGGFVSVHDVARACSLALSADSSADGQVVNVGSGESITVNEIASQLAGILGKTEIAPEVTGKFRVGDIRHCFADVSLAKTVLGYEPQVTLQQGMTELAEWLEGQVAVDEVDAATAELSARGLTV